MRLDDTLARWAPRVLSILRIVAALIFMPHGTRKLIGFPPHPNPLFDELPKWTPEAALRHRILVDDPARLHGFG